MIIRKQIIKRRVCVTVVIAFVAATVLGQDNATPVIGIVNKSVQLKCTLNISDVPDVQWEDRVYSSDTNPCLIFNNTNNTDFAISSSHPNSDSYEVHTDFTLTINLLKLEDDAGEYFCHSRVNNVLYTQSYYLTIGDLPVCFGETQLTEGQETNLTCASNYSGNNQPRLKWFRGDNAIPSKDEYEIRLAKQRVQHAASYKDDKQRFTCQMQFGNLIEECTLYMDVTFLARDLSISPADKDKYQVDDEIRCSAKGNPSPKISFEPSTSPGKLMDNTKTIVVQKSWEGKEVTLTCTASNSFDSRTEFLNKSITIQVAEPVRTNAKIRESLDKALDNTPVVIGAIIVVALVLLVIIIAVVLVRKHQEKQRQRAAKQKAAREQENGRKGGKIAV